ncbi:MAG: OprO/OprP family phosphate-selective porin [Candidatus Brocadia sp.]|nr:OprO/OprP family phosphate-selective porin [Candidatus Brocadia sp.]
MKRIAISTLFFIPVSVAILQAYPDITFAAQDPQIQYLIDRLYILEKTVNTQKEEIETLRDEIITLKEEKKPTPPLLTKEKSADSFAKETREDLKAISDETSLKTSNGNQSAEMTNKSPSNASASYVRVGYEIGKGFYLNTLDDKYLLNIHQRTQLLYTYTDNDSSNDISSFRIRRQRINFEGHVFTRDLTYEVEWDLFAESGRGELKDAYINYELTDWFQLRGGQWKVPYSRQKMTSSAKMQFVDRSLASEEFHLGRDIGIMIHGEPMEELFEYKLAAMQGAGENEKENDDTKHLYVARIAINPFGKFKSYSESDLEYEKTPKLALGTAYAINSGKQLFVRDEIMTFHNDVTVDQATADVRFKWRGLSFIGDYFWRDINAHEGEDEGFRPGGIIAHGYTLQGGYFVPVSSLQKHLEFAGRYSHIDPDTEITHDSESEVGFGINWFFKGHVHKLQADIRRLITQQEPPQDDIRDIEFRMQYQLIF